MARTTEDELRELVKLLKNDRSRRGDLNNSYSSSYNKSTPDKDENLFKSTIQHINDIVMSQSANISLNDGNLKTSISSLLNTVPDLIDKIVKGGEENIKSVWSTLKTNVFESYLTYVRQQAGLINEFNKKTMMFGELSSSFREDITESSVYAERLGVSFGEFASGITDIVANTGRFMIMNQQTLKDLALSSQLVDEGFNRLGYMAKDFSDVGLSIQYMTDFIQKATKESIGLGLNSKTTIKEVGNNIDKINQYGFKNGVDGLTKMVRQSQEFKLSMNETFKIAEKVMDPEGALELSATLQALGGAIGDFNDPIRLMYMSTNDVGGIQDALINMAKGLATFNEETGKFELIGANLRQVKAIAKDTGIEFSELSKIAISSAQRMTAMGDLSIKFPTIKEEDKEFITNLAQWSEKEGRMIIQIPENLKEQFGKSSVAVEDLSETNIEFLKSQRDYLSSLSSENIVQHQVSITENIDRNVKYIAALMMQSAGKKERELAKKALGYDPIEANKDSINSVKNFFDGVVEMGVKTTNAVGNIVNSIYDPKLDFIDNLKRDAQIIYGGEKSSKNETKKESDFNMTKHDVNVTVKMADVNSDSWTRSIRNQPEVIFDMIDSKREFIRVS